jgi:hypothetical protein
MKAVIQPDGALRLVDDDSHTDPTATYPFEDSDPPDVPGGSVLISGLELSGGLVRRVWSLSDIPLVTVTKLDIKSRVTPSEWTALKAAIATDPDAAENWELANSIDPDHPQTKQVIAYLQANGALTTPLWEVFR